MPYAPKWEQQERDRETSQRLWNPRNMNKYAEISFAVLDESDISADLHTRTMHMPEASALSTPAQAFKRQNNRN
jgi:hypothetical protein